jgi:hypothetical protein
VASPPDASDVKAAFPALANASDTLLDVKLAEATAQCNATVWGAKRDTGILWLAAHLVAIDGKGVHLKLATKTGSSIYWPTFKRLQRSVVLARGSRHT